MWRVAAACVAAAAHTAVADRDADWLVTKPTDPVTIVDENNVVTISNGLVSRSFAKTPDFGTIDMRLNAMWKYGGDQSLFRATKPEAEVVINGVLYNVGGLRQQEGFRAYCNRTDFTTTRDEHAFHFVNYSITAPVAPFPWTPGTRHSLRDVEWPPRGKTLVVSFAPPAGGPKVLVKVYYQVVVGVPVVQKWMTIESTGDTVQIDRASVELLAVMPRWGAYFTHGSHAPGSDVNGAPGAGQPPTLLHPKTDQAHVAQCAWQDDYENSHNNFPDCPACAHDVGAVEPMLNCSYSLGPGAVVSPTESFESFVVFELVIDSTDITRQTLSRHRLTQTFAPHTTENPIFFHGTNTTPAGVRAAIDQMADVGFEMFIFSFGSGFHAEDLWPWYVDEIKKSVDYAKSKGIEVGGYDLICLSRNVKFEWRAQGNEGSACFASGYFDYLNSTLIEFMDKTGLSMLETDGPYGGQTCSATDHAHHHGKADSVYKQNKLQNEFYKEMRARNVYVNQPDNYFFSGGNRNGMGYSEQQYSLPRWRDLSVSRMGMYDDLYTLLPSQGWMFVPLVDYHEGGPAAAFHGHPAEYEFALGQYLGAGTAACYRGPVPYTSGAERAALKKWVQFYKQYRETLIQPVVHLRRPDMQDWDGWVHVNPQSATDVVAVAMLFNPTSQSLTRNIAINVYYAGLTSTCKVSVDGAAAQQVTVGRDYTVGVRVAMQPKSVHYVVFTKQ